MKTYKEQANEIEKLAKSLIAKSKAFANADQSSPYFGDLGHVLQELKEIEAFLK